MGVKRPSDAAVGAEDAAAGVGVDAGGERSRLFVVCGRGRRLDELRALFGACGRIRHLHLALDRSNKSRGFAFLQYEDPVDAARAIERFDQMTLEDGHVLKVTVAKEKPSGKLKRNQHARHETDGKMDGGSNFDEHAVMDGHAPGKRQRSSPPQFTLSPSRSLTAPTISLDSIISAANDDATEVRKLKRERIADKTQVSDVRSETTSLIAVKPTPLTDDEQLAIADTLEDMLTAVVEHVACPADNIHFLSASYTKVKASRAPPAASSATSGATSVALPQQKTNMRTSSIKVEEATTDMITSSIGSVSLTGAPAVQSPRGGFASATGAVTSTASTSLRSGKPMLRRRRQSIDDSDSSGEDGQDSGGNRRKRSNTTVTPPPQGPPTQFVPLVATIDNVKMESPAHHPAAHGVRASSTIIDDSSTGRKQIKRQSSDDVHGETLRSVKQQVTASGSHLAELNPQAAGTDSVDALSTAFSSLARSRLFFVSTHKFTLQELEAMFSVYGDFEWVQIVKSFGRVKTMAYIKYSQASTAAAVVQSFEGEAATGHNSSNDEYIKLTFADPTHLEHNPPASVDLQPRRDSVNSPAGHSELTDVDGMGRYHERLWLLLLFDRFVPNHVLSSMVTACPGMEFVDIKLSSSSGESQGVAFVKFATEQHAVDAARELHQTELPIGTGKVLQALVIADPGQFSAAYGSGAGDSSGEGRQASGMADDVDIGAVEARFAHLMRNSNSDQYYASQSPLDQFQLSRDQGIDSPVIGSNYNGLPTMVPILPAMYPSAAHAAYAPSGMYGGAAPSSSGITFYPAPMTPPPMHYHQSAPPAPVAYDNQHFGFNGWMEPPPAFYHSQYFPLASAPRRPEMPPYPGLQLRVGRPDRSDDASSSSGIVTRGESKQHQRPLSPSSSDISMGSGESTSGNGSGTSDSKPLAYSILVSSARPMDFVAIVSALRDCNGMVAFRKDTASKSGDGCAYVAQFANEAQAHAAVAKLDGAMCQGVKLRVGVVSAAGGNKSGKSGSGATSRRKRQRVDARSKGRSDG